MKRRRPQPRGVLMRRTPQPLRGGRRRRRPQSAQPRRELGKTRPRRSEAPTRTGSGPDGGVLISASTLTALGIVMIYSSTAPLAIGRAVPPHLVQHLVALGLGLVVLLAALRLPLAAWRRAALPLWGVSIGLLILTLGVGVDVNGARRWLALPGLPFRFQPAELARFTTLLAVAATLARHGTSPRGTRIALALMLAPSGLLLLQPDFGSAVLLMMVCGVLLFVVGTPLLRLAALAVAGGVATVGYVALKPYALARWLGFLDPWQRVNQEGWQLVQSFIAFARGGTFGVGIGDGRQKLFYLPEAHTDFMLSVVAEELGLVGVLVVLGAFAALVLAGARIAHRARDPFVMLVAFGMTALLTLPATVNAAVVMGLLPTTGFPLPFVSYGGNSLLFCALTVGVLLRIASHEARPRTARVGAAERRWVRS